MRHVRKLSRRHRAYFAQNFVISDVTMRCKSFQCTSCYRSHPDDIFHLNRPLDEEGFEWTQEKDQGRIWSSRPRYSPFITVQCKMYIFLLLMGRRSTGTKEDCVC